MASDMGVPFLGSLPLDPELLKCCEEGRPYLASVHRTVMAGDDEEAAQRLLEQESAAQGSFRAVVQAIHDHFPPDVEDMKS